MPTSRFFGALTVAFLAVVVMLPGASSQTGYRALVNFNGMDGNAPWAGVIFDAAGNLYGTTSDGGTHSHGNIFKLTPNGNGTWTETVLYSFCSLTNCPDGASPVASLTFDGAGNLYGDTEVGGASNAGVVFELTPGAGGEWTEKVLYSFCSLTNCADGSGAIGNLTFDAAGNLYGTTVLGGSNECFDGCGTVYKLTPHSDGSWTESVIHAFAGGTDGAIPQSGLIMDQ